MNFYFGQITPAPATELNCDMEKWLGRTIFHESKDKLDVHSEAGFSLTLVNDPKQLCAHQSSKIHIDNDYVCASDCILYNKKALAELLGIAARSSNEEFIISAYKKWGKLFADKFDGKFSIALWDRRNKKLLAGRDVLGYGSFCYSQNNKTLFFASDLATLLDHPEVDKTVNQKRFYQCFRYANNTPQQTYFKYCHYCPPSHVFEFSDCISTTDYWRLDQKQRQESNLDESDNSKKLISILEQAIENECGNGRAMGLMLSGGFDSSLLAGIIARKNTWRESTTCYSYVFEKHKSCDESEFINKTTTKLNLHSSQINGDAHYVFSELPGRTIFKDIVNLDGYAALPEAVFRLASQDSKRLLVLGHFGDDLFGGNRYKFADLISTGDFKSVFNMIFSSGTTLNTFFEFLNFGIRPLLPATVKKLYRKIVKPENKNNFLAIGDSQINNIDEQFKHNSGELFHRQNLLKLIYFTNTAEGIYYYRKHLYLGHGLKYVMPFYNRGMIEFFWNLPINQLNRPNCYRWLQRLSLRTLGLEHIANRTTKTTFIELFSTGISRKRELIIRIIKNSKLHQKLILPATVMKKLENGEEIKTPEAVAINQYLLAALWWQAISDTNTSFNQPSQICVDTVDLDCSKKCVWS